jgi:predicted ribosome quality control (RQC) complex YloA/Tae2 family protein
MERPDKESLLPPVLSHSELALWVEKAESRLIGARVQRVFVPGWPEHPEGFFKKLWAIDLDTRDGPFQLVVSLMNPATGVFLVRGKPLKVAPNATRSGFDLVLHKELTSKKVVSVRAVPFDRILQIGFNGPAPSLLELHLIPARPKGIWIGPESGLNPSPPRDPASFNRQNIPHRPERAEDPDRHGAEWLRALRAEASALARKRVESGIRARLSTLEDRIRSLQEQLKRSLEETEWSSYAVLLQSHLHENPVPTDGHYVLTDWNTGNSIQMRADPGLEPKSQMERWFQLAKRKKRRIEESGTRIKDLESEKAQCLNRLENPDSGKVGTGLPSLPKKEEKRVLGFTGKQYRSREGYPILVGRNRAENLELTFKIARGNDVWLHARGRPGAHVAILLPPGKTASLDTLIDAAQLCLLHSGGKDWGKTEVDYTFRKHVKKIKNSQEVSYTQSKSLNVAVEEERLKTIISRSD